MLNKNYELRIKIYLLRDIPLEDANEILSKAIDYTMLLNKNLRPIHTNKGFKHYSFSTPYPVESDRVYKKDRIYSFMIRDYSKQKIKDFQSVFSKLRLNEFVVLTTEIKEYHKKRISHIYTITPTVLTLLEEEVPDKLKTIKTKQKCWVKGCNHLLLIDRIENNLIKKYKDLTQKDIVVNNDIIESVEITNKVPIKINYKDSAIIGNKFKITFAQNELTQEIANLSVVEGILEKNSSLGCGFVKPAFVE
ncbi:CRISPR-associated endoribonuclease Cas6 [Clostridium botulinum]|uniref:CRISPR-associated endoribonuclease Cas6 n=1 Tax=Clostridium botulinum TaxID=1491 RepID=UPI000464DC35|nr:CRISPR-associated endoribonuclease Cas6 [Clostridium botulinum]APR02486.1 putative cRISPR-associated protein, Cas6 [Clostridium botulinum]AUN01441.1 hypothetical protein RSJ19_00220 [Clostridium botulinum]MBN3359168.1 hypothetical protein [Clostridium botulinum]MBN3367243.1 hypothetical protein [Clostridium botulinum]MBN3371627.1 hypothetical protein [Clostridium botulinum]